MSRVVSLVERSMDIGIIASDTVICSVYRCDISVKINDQEIDKSNTNVENYVGKADRQVRVPL